MIRHDQLHIAFDLSQEIDSVAALIEKYADRPMSLADACLVRMSELFVDCVVLTVDSDFRFYRRFGRRAVPTRMPPERRGRTV